MAAPSKAKTSPSPATTARAPIFEKGHPLLYGQWDGRQVPCTVEESDPQSGLPSVLRVSETRPHLCKEGALITLEPSFWEGLRL